MASGTVDRQARTTRILLTSAIAVLMVLLVVLVVLFVRLVTPTGVSTPPAGAQPSLTWVRSMYGFGPSASQQLQSPSSVAIGPNGDVFATDPVHSRVVVFAPDGTFRRLIYTGGHGGKGELLRPESVAVDAQGNAYIADSWAGKIIVFDPRGKFLREWPVDLQPRGVAVDGDRVYVLDVGKVIIFDRQGHRIGAFASRGAKPGQLDAYLGVTAGDGRVYVADSYNRRVQAFDTSGTLLWSAPAVQTSRPVAGLPTTSAPSAATSTTPAGFQWDLPQDVALDGNGHLMVVDAFRFDISTLDAATGRYASSLGTFGSGEGQFYYPTSIAYDSRRDWFAVADTSNNRIEIVRIPGSSAVDTSGVWRALSSPYSYLLIPGLVLLAAIGFAAFLGKRLFRLSTTQTSADEPHVTSVTK